MYTEDKHKTAFANWLAGECRKRNLSLRQFSLRAGLHVGAGFEYTTYNRLPNPEACRKIAKFLEVPEDYVLGLAGHRQFRREDITSPEKLRLLDIIDGLPDDLVPELERFVAAWRATVGERS